MKVLINIVLSLILLSFSISFYFWLGKKEEKKKPPIKGKAGIQLKLQNPVKLDYPVSLQLWGEVKYSRFIEIKSEVEGRIIKVGKDFRPGYKVKSQQPIVEIDSERLLQKKAEIEANILKAQADHKQMDIESGTISAEKALVSESVKLAQSDVERHEDLAKKKSVSPLTLSTFRQALIRQKSMMQQLDSKLAMIPQKKVALQASVKALQSSLALMDKDIEDSKVEAPFSGVLMDPLVSAGDYVRKGDVLCRLYDPEKTEVWISIGVSEKEKLGDIRKVMLNGKDIKDARFLGATDRELQSDTLIINFNGAGLSSGDLVKCEVFGRVLKDVLVIPEIALRNDRQSVYKVVDGKLKVQIVRVALISNSNLYIEEGLELSDSVVVSRLKDAAEGTLVNQESVEKKKGKGKTTSGKTENGVKAGSK